MMSVLLSLLAFLIFVGLVAFFWFWWAVPRDQVPPHLGEPELRRLEVQDRLRQTSYQLLTAAGLAGTFLATMLQFGMNSRQWAADFELKTSQERLIQYTEAIKTIGKDSSLASQVAGITTLELLAVQDPERFHRQASEVLTQFIADQQANNKMTEKLECRLHHESDMPLLYPRDEAPPALRVAMQAVGHPQFAASRMNYSIDKCNLARQSVDHGPLWLEHLALDNLDLSGRDFSCAKMSQASLHRSAFVGADLRGVDFRGAQMADFTTPGFPFDIGNRFNLSEKDGGPPEWQRFRCWITDFRYAKLQGANFEGAIVAGSDFREADLSGADLCRADISRVNFTGAKGLTETMLKDACVGPSIDKTKANPGPPIIEEAQPSGIDIFGKDFRIARCPSENACKR